MILMKYQYACTLFCTVIALLMFAGRAIAQDQDDVGDPVIFTTPLTLTVHVKDPDGMDLADAPVQVYTSHGIDFGVTNSSGVVVLEPSYAPSQDDVAIVRLSDGSWHAGYSLEERHNFDYRYRFLTSSYAFQSEYQVDLNAQVQQYSISVQAVDAVKVSGVFVDGVSGVPVSGVGGRVLPFLSSFLTDSSGGFELSVGESEYVEFLYMLPDSRQLFIQSLSPTQTSTDVDLGQVSVQSLPSNAQVSITFANPEDDPVDLGTLRLKHANVTLVEEDAQYMLMYSTNQTRTAAVGNSWSVDEPTPLGPSGTYYVAAGMYGSDDVVALWRAVKDGRQLLLDTQGVAKVVLVDGQLVDVEFDSVQNSNAILQVGADLLD
tara:strand:+ start:7603 stop:8727 length:1125 start_codon:yes stop_codon:yes gene_type:complete